MSVSVIHAENVELVSPPKPSETYFDIKDDQLWVSDADQAVEIWKKRKKNIDDNIFSSPIEPNAKNSSLIEDFISKLDLGEEYSGIFRAFFASKVELYDQKVQSHRIKLLDSLSLIVENFIKEAGDHRCFYGGSAD